jgi:tetratricopeptide (TPR) repeat protein
VKTAQISSGWSAPPAEVESGHGRQDTGSGWSAPTAELAPSRDTEDLDSEYGWHVDSEAPAKKKKVTVAEDDWIDEEIGDFDVREAKTILVEPEPAKSGLSWVLLSSVLAICVVVFVAFGLNTSDTDQTTAEVQTTDSTALQEADTWLSSANESLEKKDYELAAVQLEKALGLLKKGKAENSVLLETRAELAQTLRLDGQLEAAHKEWSSLVGADPQAKEMKAALEKDLRVEANGLLDRSVAARKAGDFKLATATADKAQGLYKKFGGSQDQLARSLECSGRANLAGGDLVAAESDLQLAQKFAWSQDRANLLASMAPKVQATTRRPSRRPTLGEPSDIPQAARPLEPEFPVDGQVPPTVSAPVSVPVYQPSAGSEPAEAPIQYQAPANSPAYNTNQDQSQEHLGKEGVLDSYQSSTKTGRVRGY